MIKIILTDFFANGLDYSAISNKTSMSIADIHDIVTSFLRHIEWFNRVSAAKNNPAVIVKIDAFAG